VSRNFVFNLCRVRKLTEMTEKMSASLLDVVVSVTGSITAPLFQSKAGKSFLSMVPGEVLLASLDAISKTYILNFTILHSLCHKAHTRVQIVL
jgi:Senescence-associated protein